MNEDKKLYDVCIIGAGFSGLVLAIKLARAGLLVCLVELNRIVGRRILSTGNGRCNFTNSRMSSDYYYSEETLDFITDNHQEIVDFMYEIGVINKDLDGYYYPFTNQAKTVRDALENEINALDIDVYLDNRVTDINKNDIFTVVTNRNSFDAKFVCVACGGLSAATLGSSKLGYKMAQKFKMHVTKLAPSLVGVTSNDICLKDFAGIRATGTVTYRDYSCHGEIQFNKDGISGYPVMCISRFIGFDQLNKSLSDIKIDFVPYFSEEELLNEIKTRFERFKDVSIEASLIGLCNEKLLAAVISYARIYSDTVVSKLDDEDINNLVYYFKNFTIGITGTKGFDSSQVTAGGVSLKDINTMTMESNTCTNLFFTGEVLDVDGICGGYNLNWAFTSATLASNAIIKRMNND